MATASPTLTERIRQAYFNAHRWRSDGGAPLVSAELVAEMGRRGRILDVRTEEELRGPLGYIPGATWVPAHRIADVATRLPPTAFVVLVSRGGGRARKLAQYLELLGMDFVAALDGGMRDWRNKGFVTRHDTDVLARTVDTLEPNLDDDEVINARATLSRDEVVAHIGDPGAVRWVKVAAMVVSGKLACVDGRDDRGIVGTPGGNAGEFLLALGAIELVTGAEVNPAHVPHILAAYIDASGRFYMHSDSHALRELIARLQSMEAIAHLLPPDAPDAWRRFTAAPPEAVRPVLLELLGDPHHIGCGHLRRMLLHPERYGVRAELTRAFLRAIWELYWAGSTDIAIPVLSGDHAEEAVVNVVLDDAELSAFSRAPMVSPSTSHGQMFLNTPQVATFLREASISFMLRHPEWVPLRAGQTAEYHDAIAALAARQAAETLGALAQGLPVYEVRFHDEERFTVTQTA
jgi:rhodanese-related sulfurtransferase